MRLLILTEEQDDWLQRAMQLWDETFARQKTAEAARGRIIHGELWRQLNGHYTEEQKDQILNLAADISMPELFRKPPAKSPPGAS